MKHNFYLVGHDENDKRISLYIYLGGERKTFNTGLRINPKHWNDKQRAKKSLTGYLELNRSLDLISERIQTAYSNFKAHREPVSKLYDQIKYIVSPESKPRIDFFNVLDDFIELKKQSLAKNTIKQFNTFRTHIIEFKNYTKREISFENMDLKFYDEFVTFLQNEKDHNITTIGVNVKKLKIFLNWCYDREIIEHQKYKKFKVRTLESPMVTLTEIELFKLYNMELDNYSLNRVRDLFCFMCFTGQRISDIKKLKRTDIKRAANGQLTWINHVQKTKEPLVIPLNSYAASIINKYKDNENPIPLMSEQKANMYIKELCSYAKIDEPIKYIQYKGGEQIEVIKPKYEMIANHTARRTFVTLSLEKGMRPEVIMKITGHKDLKVFQKYIKITSKVVENELLKVWNEPQKVFEERMN